MSRELSVVIACGGTGGHLFPGIAVAEELKRRGHHPLLLISQKKVDSDASEKYGDFEFETVAAIAKPPTLSPKMLPFLWRLWKTIGQSKRLLVDHQVDAVIDELKNEKSRYPYVSFHPQGTCRMGADPKTTVVGPRGETHDVKNLYIVDASLLPTSIGYNPSETVYALASYISDQINADHS